MTRVMDFIKFNNFIFLNHVLLNSMITKLIKILNDEIEREKLLGQKKTHVWGFHAHASGFFSFFLVNNFLFTPIFFK